MSDTIRTRRVAELLKKEIAAILAKEIHDPRVHDVVITSVKVTKDLSMAWVYYSSYNKSDMLDIEIGLEKSKGFIRKRLMSSVHLKRLPQIDFRRDHTPEGVERLDEIFDEINQEKSKDS